MSTDEFLELRKWMIDRWPALSSFTQGQWLAYRDELDRFDISNVWSALQVYASTGPEFPPAVLRLKRLTSEEEQGRQRKALPEPLGVSWAEYSLGRWGRAISLFEAGLMLAEGKLK